MYTRVNYKRNKGKRFLMLLFIVCFIASFAYLYYEYNPEILFSNKHNNYESLIRDISKRHSIDPDLVRAVIWKESNFDKNATGQKGEVGLMQIRPEKGAVTDWEKQFNQKISCRGVLFRPEINIEIGAWYLSKAVKNWSGYKYQYELALSEYNAGRRGMKPWVPDKFDGEVVKQITIPSTKDYVKAIMEQYQKYKASHKRDKDLQRN